MIKHISRSDLDIFPFWPGGGTGQPLAKIKVNDVYYYHNDHLGTPMMMTDSTGTTVWQGEFLPFGEEYSVTGTVTNNLRFPGQYYDEENRSAL